MKRFSNPGATSDVALSSPDRAATKRLMSHLSNTTRASRTSAFRVARAAAFVTAMVLTGCSSSSDTGSASSAEGSGDCKTGANAAFANPAGTPFTLPAGIALEGEMTGDVEANCEGKSFVEYGSDLISICVGLRNSTNAAITVTIPAGLVFLAKDPASQNGIVLHSHDLEVPAGGVAYFYFRPFCLNEHCIYGRKQDRYTFGNVASDAGLREIIALADKKSIDSNISAYVLGQMIWAVTGGKSITDEQRTQLNEAADR